MMMTAEKVHPKQIRRRHILSWVTKDVWWDGSVCCIHSIIYLMGPNWHFFRFSFTSALFIRKWSDFAYGRRFQARFYERFYCIFYQGLIALCYLPIILMYVTFYYEEIQTSDANSEQIKATQAKAQYNFSKDQMRNELWSSFSHPRQLSPERRYTSSVDITPVSTSLDEDDEEFRYNIC